MSHPTSKTRFSIHGLANFSIHGSGSLYDYLKFEYQDFINGPEALHKALPGVHLSIQDGFPLTLETELKNGNERYGVDVNHQYFVWSVAGKRVILDGRRSLSEQSTLTISTSFNKMKANLIFEGWLRLQLIQAGFVLVHAAAICKGAQSILVPAWKGMGKTSVCLKLVESGYHFMSDDRVFLSGQGALLSLPRYVVIKHSNAMFFQQFLSLKARIGLCLFRLQDLCKHAITKKSIGHLARRAFPPRHMRIHSLYPEAVIQTQAMLTHVLCIQKTENIQEAVIEESTASTLASAAMHIGNVEWNHDLLNIAAAHDILFPNDVSWTAEIHALMNQEEQVMQSAFNHAQVVRILRIPSSEQHMQWPQLVRQISAL